MSDETVPTETVPTVTVVIPVFDRPHLLQEAVDSVLTQRGVDVEIVVVDDGSGPETAAVVDRLAAEHPGLIALRQPNAGPSAARNRGVAASSGEWLSFLDSDDLMPPDRLREQVDALQSDPSAIVLGEQQIEVAPGVEPPSNIVMAMRSPRPRWLTISFMSSRATFDAVGGFDESMRWGEDTEFLFRAHGQGVPVLRRESIWVIRRVFGDNLVMNEAEMQRAMTAALRNSMRRKP